MATMLQLPEALDLAQQLPAGPRLLAELGRLVRDPATDAEDVVRLLRRDASLVSRIIRMANSAAYAGDEPTASIEQAVIEIGFGEVHRLVGALAAVQLADRPQPLHGTTGSRWRTNALFVATLMEEFAGRAGLDPRAAYTAGLLRAIGQPVLERAAETAGFVVPPFAPAAGERLAAWQRRHWGLDGWTIAAEIFAHWHLPAQLVAALAHYETPEGRPEPVVHLLQLAVGVAARDRYGLPGDEPRSGPGTVAAAGLTPDGFHNAVHRAEEVFQRLRTSIA
jgi:HD-like signal output (HDOD) protein